MMSHWHFVMTWADQISGWFHGAVLFVCLFVVCLFVLLPPQPSQYSCGNPHGQRSLVGCSPWGCEESDTTEWLHFHFSLSCIGEGNGNPLQCSCLENPRGGGVWWAAVYGVTQSRTRLKRLSSSSSRLLSPGGKNFNPSCECIYHD